MAILCVKIDFNYLPGMQDQCVSHQNLLLFLHYQRMVKMLCSPKLTFSFSFVFISSEVMAECFLNMSSFHDKQDHGVCCHRRSIWPVKMDVNTTANNLTTIPFVFHFTSELLQTYNSCDVVLGNDCMILVIAPWKICVRLG